MHKNYQANVQKKVNALAPIVDTIKLCSRQNLPTRGHRDSVKEQPKVGMPGLNSSGDFVELLHYRCRGGDTDLKHHLELLRRKPRIHLQKYKMNLLTAVENLL